MVFVMVTMGVMVGVSMVSIVVGVRILVVALFAVEDQKVHTERVKRRNKHPGQHREVGETSGGQMALSHGFNDAVLGIEAGEKWRTNQRQRPEQGRNPGNRHVFAHAAHPADVLVVVHAHDDRTSAQEQQGLEKRVRHQMEHRHRVGRRPQRHGHIAELRQRGIRHHALDVVLDDAQKAHEQGGNRANDQNEVQRRIRQLKQGRHACHHKNTGSDHGGGVNQGGNRRRAFHGIWQPDVQRKLGRLAHGTNEQADADHGDQHPIGAGQGQRGQARSFAKHLCVVQGAGISRQQANAQNETKVAHAVDQEGLHIGKNGAGLVVPKADQQVGHQSHRLPAKKQLQQVVAHHQHQHGKGKQGDVSEESVVSLVLVHVADGVQVHHEGDKGHHAHHHRGQTVDHEADFHPQATHHHPGVERLVQTGTVLQHTVQRHGGYHKCKKHPANGQRVGDFAPYPVAAKLGAKNTSQHRAHQGRHGHNKQRGCTEGLTHLVFNP